MIWFSYRECDLSIESNLSWLKTFQRKIDLLFSALNEMRNEIFDFLSIPFSGLIEFSLRQQSQSVRKVVQIYNEIGEI